MCVHTVVKSTLTVLPVYVNELVAVMFVVFSLKPRTVDEVPPPWPLLNR